MSENVRHQVSQGQLNTGLTGVLPSYQRKGMALALKIKAIKAAKALSIKDLSPWNATHDTAVLATLVFQKQLASMDDLKKL